MTKKSAAVGTKRDDRRHRVTFPKISEEMKEWSALLARELHSWPQITTKKMFGFLAFYRNGTIFAALPRTRGFDSPSSLIFKFHPMAPKLLKRAKANERMDGSTRVLGHGWSSYQLRTQADLRDVVWWLSQAYEAVRR